MRLEEFDYHLPKSLIAQYPSPRRGESRLMVLNRSQGSLEHRTFGELAEFLEPGDLLVMNNTRVLPARLFGNKETGGKIELLLIPSENRRKGQWDVLVRNAGKIKGNLRIRFGLGLSGVLKEVKGGKGTLVLPEGNSLEDLLNQVGRIPLPPYIKREDEPLDRERYQTIYAEKDGSIAAPTAGLHFTNSLIQTLKEKGINTASITLHIGLGTFTPIKTKEIEAHRMDREWAEVTEEAAEKILETKRNRKRVIAVGTTTTRALESFSDAQGHVEPGRKEVTLFIYPSYRFKVIDGLITNFHLPKSTLILLVAAFASKSLIMDAYQEAVRERYRFYSYGDAMLIL